MPKHKEMQNSNMGSEGTYHFGAAGGVHFPPLSYYSYQEVTICMSIILF